VLPALVSKSERAAARIQDDILCKERYDKKLKELAAQKENMEVNIQENATSRRLRGFLLQKASIHVNP
jgi:hypothetical protein